MNGGAATVFRGNWISDNDWGFTITSNCDPNLGSAGEPGANALVLNGNNGTQMECFNATSAAVPAVGNWWGTTDPATIESRINDDDDGAFGEIQFQPFLQDSSTGLQLRVQPAWRVLPEGESLVLDPASHFRSGESLEINLSGPGLFSGTQEHPIWQPDEQTSCPALLIFNSQWMEHSLSDSLWVFHQNISSGAEIALSALRLANGIELTWTAVLADE